MQQQSVLLLAARGPDGISKAHPCKKLVQRYRAAVLKAAYRGRALRVDEVEGGGDFMTLAAFSNADRWFELVADFFDYGDDLPHHYRMHFLHGAEIIGYKHPEQLFRERWGYVYLKGCRDLHLNFETEYQMDNRLGDWGQKHWDVKESVNG